MGGIVMDRRQMKYVLLDFEGEPIRYFDYPASGTVEVKEDPIDLSKMEDCLF
jgi:hypothetical protein